MICSLIVFFLNNPDPGPKLRLDPDPNFFCFFVFSDPIHCTFIGTPRNLAKKKISDFLFCFGYRSSLKASIRIRPSSPLNCNITHYLLVILACVTYRFSFPQYLILFLYKVLTNLNFPFSFDLSSFFLFFSSYLSWVLYFGRKSPPFHSFNLSRFSSLSYLPSFFLFLKFSPHFFLLSLLYFSLLSNFSKQCWDYSNLFH